MTAGCTLSLTSARRALLAAAAAAAVGWSAPLHAEPSTYRVYDANQGLTSLSGRCVGQDGAGLMLVCTQHGVFTYDGRSFVNLGPAQGLREGGEVFGIAKTAQGRVAVAYADEVYISDAASDASHPPVMLSFRPVSHPGVAFFADQPRRLTAWQGGLAFLAGDLAVSVAAPGAEPARFETLGYDVAERRLLEGAAAVFSVQGTLWETFEDGRICSAEPGAVRCYGVADGLTGERWLDLAADPRGGVVARSAESAARLDPATSRWSVGALPDQGGPYDNYVNNLGLFPGPGGTLFTQAAHGLAVLGPNGWSLHSIREGAPAGVVTSAFTDADGQLWFQVFGRGVVRWAGYGRWDTVKAEGATSGIPWRSARADDGSLWVTTDSGVDRILPENAGGRLARVLPEASFAITAGPRGELWVGTRRGLKLLKSSAAPATDLKVPMVNAIAVCRDDAVWLGTEAGLFAVADRPAGELQPRLATSPKQSVPDVVCDRAGGVFYLADGRLHHRHGDGRDVMVLGPWPERGFLPLTMAFGHDRTLWIGGDGGLHRFFLDEDRVTGFDSPPTEVTRSNGIFALMTDHRGWVWVGTARGVSVFDGSRWVSLNSDDGLVSDDVNDGGIREDPDGSVWITTTQGLSHLLDPGWIFNDRPLDAVVSSAMLGSQPLPEAYVPYTEDALTLQFGTSDYEAERSVVFRYQLSGVDAAVAVSNSGAVRYPFVPPGRHVLSVVAYNELTHRSSPPTTRTIEVGYPWWRQTWAYALWAVIAAGFVYGVTRLRVRAMSARQAELQRHVVRATEMLRQDSLTGLLNRYEIERCLGEKLAGARTDDGLIVALMDIDYFKRVNDERGHLGGDEVLRAMGALVLRALRAGERAGRYGGEEFLLLLDDADGRGAERILDLHNAVRGTPFIAAGHPLRVTCSIGMTWVSRGEDWDSLIGRADDALYEAKASGRDRVIERPRGVEVMRTPANERRSASKSL